jgi:hypothetical protein
LNSVEKDRLLKIWTPHHYVAVYHLHWCPRSLGHIKMGNGKWEMGNGKWEMGKELGSGKEEVGTGEAARPQQGMLTCE